MIRRQTAFALSLIVSSGLTSAALAQESGDLAKAAQNPVAAMISLPFQNNTLFGVGPDDDVANVLNIQPVIPFTVGDWNIINRTIVPVIYLPDVTAGLPELPEGISGGETFGLGDIWANRGYYGSLYHDVAATYVLYLGWFDGNPATLHELPPAEASRNYVEFMGGADAVLAKAKESFNNGDYRWVAQVVNHVVFADPDNQEAKDLQADALEQLGYQAESGPWRNFYLTGAKELREGVAQLPTPNTASPDTVRAMTLEMFFDYLGVRLDSAKAADADMALNFDFGDSGEQHLVELENGVLNHTADRQADDADATVTLTRDTLNDIILQQTKLTDAISSGDVSIDGDQAKLEEVISYLDTFEFWFNIATP